MKNWADGKEGDMLNAMSATFGSFLPGKADQAVKSPAVFSNPPDCCSPSTSKVSHIISFAALSFSHFILFISYSHIDMEENLFIQQWSFLVIVLSMFSRAACSLLTLLLLLLLLLQLSGSVALCVRGTCDFATKASFAQSGGATAMLMMSDSDGKEV